MKKSVRWIVMLLLGFFSLSLTGCDENDESINCATYEVSFDGNGGALVSGDETQNVCDPSKISAPKNSRYGYVFSGWDTDLNMVKEKKKIRAKWTPLLTLNGFDILEDETLYGEVDNEVNMYSFLNKINVNENATWRVFSDMEGKKEIITKTASLDIGDNTFYIFVEEDPNNAVLYTVRIRRLSIIKNLSIYK